MRLLGLASQAKSLYERPEITRGHIDFHQDLPDAKLPLPPHRGTDKRDPDPQNAGRRSQDGRTKPSTAKKPLPGGCATYHNNHQPYRHSYATTSRPPNQNFDSASANLTSPSPRLTLTLPSSLLRRRLLRFPNRASHFFSASASVPFTRRNSSHSTSASRSGVACDGELRISVVMRAE